jgi:hypothetical protein
MKAQELRDLRAARDDLERRVHDLKLTRQVTMQSLPSIRLVQENDKSLVTKINSTLVNTVPLWETQLAQAVTIQRSKEAAEAVREANDLTNELLKANAENLQEANRVVREEMERGVFDIEAVKKANATLIATINESLAIADEGKARAPRPRPNWSRWKPNCATRWPRRSARRRAPVGASAWDSDGTDMHSARRTRCQGACLSGPALAWPAARCAPRRPARPGPAAPPAAVPPYPAPKVRAAQAYYAQVQQALLSRGLLRTDGGADAPFHRPDAGRKLHAHRALRRIPRGRAGWCARNGKPPAPLGPAGARGVRFGASVPRRPAGHRPCARIASYLARLSAITGHPIRLMKPARTSSSTS